MSEMTVNEWILAMESWKKFTEWPKDKRTDGELHASLSLRAVQAAMAAGMSELRLMAELDGVEDGVLLEWMKEKKGLLVVRRGAAPGCAAEVGEIPLQKFAQELTRLNTQHEVLGHVTLLQMAAIVNKSKHTLERLCRSGKLPAPDIEGGAGKANEWRWSVVKPVLEKTYRRMLPDRFPTDRFVRSQ